MFIFFPGLFGFSFGLLSTFLTFVFSFFSFIFVPAMSESDDFGDFKTVNGSNGPGAEPFVPVGTTWAVEIDINGKLPDEQGII